MQISLFLCALLFSTIGTIAGFGGGIFLVPIMIVGFHTPVEIAIGVTALSLFPSSLLSSILNTRNRKIDFRLLIALEIPTVVGAFVGAQLTNLIPTRPLEYCFVAFLFFLSWKVMRPTSATNPLARIVAALNNRKPFVVNSEYRVSLWSASFFGTLAGTVAGLFGIGGGILKTPMMINVFKVPVRVATATGLGMIVITSLISGATHYQLGHVSMDLLLSCAGGLLAGSIVGNFLNVKIAETTIRKIISLSVFLAAIAVLIHVIKIEQ